MSSSTDSNIELLMKIISYGGEESMSKIQEFLDKGVDINEKDKYEQTALMLSATKVDKHGILIMQMLLDNKADPNFQDDVGMTALINTARFGYTAHIARNVKIKYSELYGRGCGLFDKEHKEDHSISMMWLLLNKGADPNMWELKDKWTALMYAARYRGEYGLKMTRLLLDMGADPNIKSKEGNTALMIATEEEPEDEYALSIMSELLNKGADPNIQNKCGFTAGMNASLLECDYAIKMVSLLVAHGARLTWDCESCLEMLQSPGPQVESVLHIES